MQHNPLFVVVNRTWNGDVGVFGEGGQAQQQFNHGEGVDVVDEATNHSKLSYAVDALNG
jgi:hypothetical protein